MKNKIFNDLSKAMTEYEEITAKNLTEESLKKMIDPNETMEILIYSISEIGDKFDKGELWLPDLMMAAKTMKIAMLPLEEEIRKRGLKKHLAGKIVIGTVFGDLHTIGKTMVATLLTANGFEVIDIGENVDAKRFIEAVHENNPDILAMSALLTTTAQEQEKVIIALKNAGMRNKIKVMVGGGPITREFAEKIGADGYEPTATLAVKLAKKLIKK